MISSSPFTPWSLAPIEFFAGRMEEVRMLRGLVAATGKGSLRVGFITGERGLAKSSLASVVRHLVEQDGEAVGCHVHLGEVKDLRGLMETALDQVLKDSVNRPWRGKILQVFGDRVQKVGLLGAALELKLTKEDLRSPNRSFLPALHHLLSQDREDRDSLLLILDDINGLARSREFANWLKSTVDDVATSRRENKLCILLVGVEERIRQMMEKQPSVVRVFTRVNIAPWTAKETKDFYRNAFRRKGATVSEEGLRTLEAFTGGFPVLAHEIGAAVWNGAEDLEIKDLEVFAGIWRAADIMAQRFFFSPGGLELVRSKSCQSILGKMDQPRMAIRRADFVDGPNTSEGSKVDRLLARMKKVGILKPSPTERGEYQFPTLLHALSIWLETRPRKKARPAKE